MGEGRPPFPHEDHPQFKLGSFFPLERQQYLAEDAIFSDSLRRAKTDFLSVRGGSYILLAIRVLSFGQPRTLRLEVCVVF